MSAIKEMVTLDFGEDNVPRILFHHMHYNRLRKRDISKISSETFKTYQSFITDELRKEFSKLKNQLEKNKNRKNALKEKVNKSTHYKEINKQLEIINDYKKKYWENKKEINSLKSKLTTLENKGREILIQNRSLERSYRVYYNMYLKEKGNNDKLKKSVGKYEDVISSRSKEMLRLFDLIENKKEYILKNPKSVVSLNVCIHCLKVSKKDKKKCIHPNCVGVCEECCQENESKCEDMCLACNKKREIQCPICLETCKEKDVFKNPSKKCEHSICYSCFTSSYFDAKKPVNKCPLCRVDFK